MRKVDLGGLFICLFDVTRVRLLWYDYKAGRSASPYAGLAHYASTKMNLSLVFFSETVSCRI